MARVNQLGLVTEHATTFELAARLAACCTFFYADQRDKARREHRPFNDRAVPVQLVYLPDGDLWRLAEVGAGVGTAERVVATYHIDGRSSEGEVARTFLKLIDPVVS